MRVNAFVTALGLSAAEMVAAGVCRPSSLLSSESASATEASSSTVSILTEASSTTLSVATQTSSTASTDVSLTALSVSTDAPSTTLSVSATSAAETTSTTEAATFTTSAGPPPIPTFNVVANGGGSAEGTRLSSSRRAPFITFGYTAVDAGDELFSIEPETGRLKTSSSDTYVCATFGDRSVNSHTGRLGNCIQQNIDAAGDYIAYLKCGLDGGKVTCTAPLTTCYDQDFEWYCDRDGSGATMGALFVYPANSWGYTVGIGPEVPNGYPGVEWDALVV
ncbi:hypothetical protein ACHAPT_008441 [Fusarium lateritium]